MTVVKAQSLSGKPLDCKAKCAWHCWPRVSTRQGWTGLLLSCASLHLVFTSVVRYIGNHLSFRPVLPQDALETVAGQHEKLKELVAAVADSEKGKTASLTALVSEYERRMSARPSKEGARPPAHGGASVRSACLLASEFTNQHPVEDVRLFDACLWGAAHACVFGANETIFALSTPCKRCCPASLPLHTDAQAALGNVMQVLQSREENRKLQEKIRVMEEELKRSQIASHPAL